jgi:hypothetical protein
VSDGSSGASASSERPARLTARQLNRATLARQLLLERAPLDPVAAVERIVAIQAQEAASPYVALWNRIARFDPQELDRAFGERAIVKASLMRITLHAVTAIDYPLFHAAMQQTLRAARLNDARFADAGLSVSDADSLVPGLLDFTHEPRTNAELDAWLREHAGVPGHPGIWWAVRSYAPLIHAPTGGPWTFGRRPSYLAAPGNPVTNRDASLRHLARRYLEGFGPASARDLAQFALVPVSVARQVLGSLVGTVETCEGPDGVLLFDVPGQPLPPGDTPAPPRLMAMWDSVLLAYADRSRLVPPEYRSHVTRRNGDVLPTLLVDGFVAGVWRPLDGAIEATAFHPLSDEEWGALDAEATRLVAFLADRDPAVYRRYARWWDALPSAEIRVLGGQAA